MSARLSKSCFLIMWFTFALVGTVSGCNSSPCQIAPDRIYKGTLLNCSHTGMSSTCIGKLKYPNITTLIISNNDMIKLDNESFSHFLRLKRLECELCNLSVLQVDALVGLKGLEVLLLRQNHLIIKNHAFPFGFFRHVRHLKVLHLDHNGNQGYAPSYSEFIDIFDSLPELINLKIDSFSNLTIGEEFTRLKRLNSLEISCKHLENINNESLSGFENSSVKHFALLDGSNTLYDEEDCDLLFQFLPNISSLKIENVKFGNIKLLKMLKPLESKVLDLLYFDNVGLYLTQQRGEEQRLQDRIFSAAAVQSLKNICIHTFVWLKNYAILNDLDALTSGQWRHCLRSLTMVTGGSVNIVNHVYLYQLTRLRKLENFIFMIEPQKVENNFWEVNKIPERSYITDEYDNMEFGDMSKFHGYWPRSITNFSESFTEGHMHSKSKSEIQDSYNADSIESFHQVVTLKRSLQPLNAMYVYVPTNLKNIVFDHTMTFAIPHDVCIKNNTIRSVYIRRLREECYLNGQVLGMDSLEIFDLTGSAITGKPTFFKWFPALRKLILENTRQTSTYYSQVAASTHRVEYFNIADNTLEWLPKRMFHSNSHLKYLSLASNRFGKIPFDLELTQSLEILDLRKNSIVLTLTDLQSFDNHLHHGTNFTLLLSENQISCACSALPFLQWLQYTAAHLDNDGNYTCVTEEGTLSHTASFRDNKAFWRECHGTSYLLISLILLSSLSAMYMAAFLGMKHKTRIISSMMQLVLPGFKLKTRTDFNFDVVIGYADQDVNFVIDVLMRYLEDMWHLKTFVHQRDMLHDPLMMSQAIKDSWRSLLLITENFLDRHHMAHNVMKVCTFFVNPSNPRSVIVMVEESVRHRIPDYVLQVVDEDNIIVLPSLQGWLDYETKETLKTRIF